MNEAHLHVALNHFPVVGAIISAVILFAGILRKNSSIRDISFWLFIFIALLSIPVLLTGESAKETIEHLQGINEETIETHERLARITFGLLIATGLASGIHLFLLKIKKHWPELMTLVAVLAVFVTVFAGITANAGGKIRHSEFENSTVNDNEELKPGEQDEPETKMEEYRSRKKKGRNN